MNQQNPIVYTYLENKSDEEIIMEAASKLDCVVTVNEYIKSGGYFVLYLGANEIEKICFAPSITDIPNHTINRSIFNTKIINASNCIDQDCVSTFTIKKKYSKNDETPRKICSIVNTREEPLGLERVKEHYKFFNPSMKVTGEYSENGVTKYYAEEKIRDVDDNVLKWMIEEIKIVKPLGLLGFTTHSKNEGNLINNKTNTPSLYRLDSIGNENANMEPEEGCRCNEHGFKVPKD
jgi:hypothetical protein